ncbi:MAG: hypothetical protein ACREEB_12805 [Caulobacteraceae bacterium]
MRFMITAAALMALAFASTADAKSCKDAKGHFIKCPAAAAAPMAAKPMAAAKPAPRKRNAGGGTMFTAKSGKAAVCKTGVPCGKSCIPKGKVCHK